MRPPSRRGTFYNAVAFDQPITDWDTSQVTVMKFVLRAAASPIGTDVCSLRYILVHYVNDKNP